MSFGFQYPIKRVTSSPFASSDLLSHTYMNEIGQNLYNLGEYVGNPASIVRTKNGNQTLTTNSIITNWSDTSIEDPLGIFILGADSITITQEGLYTISYSTRMNKQNTSGGNLEYLIYSEFQFNNGAFVRAKSGAHEVVNNGGFFIGFPSSNITQFFRAGTVVKLNLFDINNRSTVLEGTNTTMSIARQG